MSQTVIPLSSRSHGTFQARLPGSKSFTNRSLIIAAQRMGETTISGALHSDDTDHLARVLDGMEGLAVTKTAVGYRVVRELETVRASGRPAFINGAGTPARLLMGFAASLEGETLITGNARLSERPMGDLLTAFADMGIPFKCEGRENCLPIRIAGKMPSGDKWSVSGAISSQFTSSLLLLAASREVGRKTIVEVQDRLVSRPYVEMTLRMLRDCGIPAYAVGDQSFEVVAARPSLAEIAIEPDASAMSYVLAAAAITGTAVRVPGIPEDSAQGDLGFAYLLEKMGCTLSFDGQGMLLRSSGRLSGIEADMDTMPDTVLTLAAIAPFASSPTTITNVANLRVKECDRLSAAATELTRLGVKVEEGEDWIRVYPASELNPASIKTYDDHRVAMAFSLPGLIQGGIRIEEPECVKKSFPTYWDELERFRCHHQANAA